MQHLTQSLPVIKACFFDFDGVIIDSEAMHNEIKCSILDRFAMIYQMQVVIDYQGRSSADFYRHVAGQLVDANGDSPPLNVEQMMYCHKSEFLKKRKLLQLIKGVEQVIAWSKTHCAKTLIVSSSRVEDIRFIIDQYFASTTFDDMVTYEDTKRHKPSPEPYQVAISKCGYKAEQCLVIEDSPSGVQAAKRAGCFVVAITTTFSAKILVAVHADLVVASYDELIGILPQAAAIN